ncbi:hypothetical protein L1887_09903 [Cichorium endivia]|nr:hypothetical protein L1887_09903 [Cichorium endivia]
MVAGAFLENQRDGWSKWFLWLRRWDDSALQMHRAVWIKKMILISELEEDEGLSDTFEDIINEEDTLRFRKRMNGKERYKSNCPRESRKGMMKIIFWGLDLELMIRKMII